MAKRRATVSSKDAQRTLGTDILDRLLEAEGLVEVPVVEVPIEQIDPNPYQTRRDFDEEGLEELATSMRVHGFYGHLVGRQVEDRYQLGYGQRRVLAAQSAGLTTIPVVVRDLTDAQMMEIAITENVQRKDLNPIEEAEAYKQLTQLGYSYRQISARVAKSPGHISMLLNLLRQEDVTESVRHQKVGIREAHEIAKVEDAEQRRELLERMARRELDRDALKAAVRTARRRGVSTTLARIYDPIPNLRSALTRLEKVRPDRFSDMDKHMLPDVRTLLEEIASRVRFFLEQLEK